MALGHESGPKGGPLDEPRFFCLACLIFMQLGFSSLREIYSGVYVVLIGT